VDDDSFPRYVAGRLAGVAAVTLGGSRVPLPGCFAEFVTYERYAGNNGICSFINFHNTNYQVLR
jgi:hypothetical protein